MSTRHILVLSTADWDAALWTNKQYMSCELASDFEVTYVESLGLRRPQLTVRDFRRILQRLRRVVAQAPDAARPAARGVPDNVSVVSPLVVPWHRFPTRALNRVLLRRAVRSWLATPRAERVLWTYTPATYGLEDEAAATVYHAVDLLGSYPGIDSGVVERGERVLAARGVRAVASSREVAAHLRRVGFADVRTWSNVASVEPFTAASKPAAERDGALVVFGGNLSPYKLDTSHIRAVVDACPSARVVLAGPVAEGGGHEWPGLRDLLTTGRVESPGACTLEELADLYGRASVGIIPYLHNDYTLGVHPLKVNEYLASGLAVVSTALPSLDADGEDVILADDPSDFAAAVAARLGPPADADISRRQKLAAAGSWTVRGVQAREFVHSLPVGRVRRIPRRTRVAKRVLDVVGAVTGLVALSPVMLAAAVAVKVTSPGPVLFRQPRVGRNGTTFDVLKFRSMAVGTDAQMYNGTEVDESYRAGGYKLAASDQRITPVGRKIRAWSVDELPQLVNVLRGEMSLVGIRPLVAAELEDRDAYDQELYRRLAPGLTGLWQVEGRSDITDEERFALDRRYAQEVSLFGDIVLLWKTPMAVLGKRGAR